MKHVSVAFAVLAAVAVVGCASAPADMDNNVKPGSGAVLNPSGKPQNSDQAAYASQMEKAGNAINEQREKDAAAMAAAKARTGGK